MIRKVAEVFDIKESMFEILLKIKKNISTKKKSMRNKCLI